MPQDSGSPPYGHPDGTARQRKRIYRQPFLTACTYALEGRGWHFWRRQGAGVHGLNGREDREQVVQGENIRSIAFSSRRIKSFTFPVAEAAVRALPCMRCTPRCFLYLLDALRLRSKLLVVDPLTI